MSWLRPLETELPGAKTKALGQDPLLFLLADHIVYPSTRCPPAEMGVPRLPSSLT